MRHILCIALCILSLTACKTTYNAQSWSLGNGEGVGLQVNWIKNKGDTLDVEFSVTNRYPFEVVVSENSLQCSVDGQGTHSQRTNRRLVIPTNGRRVGIAVLEYHESVRGASEAVFTLDRIHKGAETTEVVTETTGSANTFATAKVNNSGSVHGNAFTFARSSANSHEQLGFREGERLPPARLSVNLGGRAPATR